MSKNSKNARKIQEKRAWRGNKPGPAKTKPQHNKKNTWWNKKDGKATAAPVKRREDEDNDES